MPSRGGVQSLESLLNNVGNVAEFLRNQQTGPNVYPGVPAEYTNWRDEQRAWQQSCVLFNQSYHMAELMVEGPDALAFLNGLGVNSFKGFAPDKAKQFVPVQSRRLRHRRRDPVLPGGKPVQSGGPRADAELGAVPCRRAVVTA